MQFENRGFLGGKFDKEANKNFKFSKGTVKRLVKYAGKYWFSFLISLAMIILLSYSGLLRPYLIKLSIDNYITRAINGIITKNEAYLGLYNLSIIFFGLIIFEFVFKYFQTILLQSTGKKIIMNLRNNIFEHIQRLPVSYFDKNSVGRIVTRVTNDTDSLNELFTDIIVSLIQDIFIMAGIIFIMLKISPSLTLISFTVVPIMVISTLFFKNRARKIFNDIRTKLSQINSFLAENISGIKIIQVFNMQNKKLKEFEKINSEYFVASQKQINLMGFFRPFMDIVRSLSLALILWFGGNKILNNSLEFGTLFLFTDYISKFFQPIAELTDKFNTLQASIVSSERIFELLDEASEKEPENEMVNDNIIGKIEFKNVWFYYNDENWVLKDVSFVLEKGMSAAFVGATGAGKTSIINLICGFYQNQRGQILIDDIDIKSIDKKILRKNIGLVLQDVFLFSGDIEANINMFDKNITLDMVKKAAEYVNASYFIEKLEGSYKHQISEKGSSLSTGERQLISFARAIVTKPKILLMDEATSNIDTNTELLIKDALSKIMKDRTTIAVAHRLSTIKNADIIFVMQKGEIAEKGNHTELFEKKGIYHKLYMLQYNDENL